MAHNLINDPPDTVSYEIGREHYLEIIKAMRSNPQVTNLVIESDNLSGKASAERVDFSWSYDGVTELKVTVLKKHSWQSKIAGNYAIFDAIQKHLIDEEPIS